MIKLKVGLLLFVLLVGSCNNNKKAVVTAKSIKDTTAKKIVYSDTPEFPSHIALLLSYWKRNKLHPVFDTTIGFEDQGFGAIDPYYNFIEAGHLFSDKQIHAVLFYEFALKDRYTPLARLQVYKRNETDTSWQTVLDDTIDVGEFQFKYKDWNNDGIRDLCYVENGWEHGGHGPISWHLWVVDKKGVPKQVKGFEELDDPKIDSFTNHIFSDIEFHTGEQIAEYKLVGNKIVKMSDDMVVEYDSPNVVTYYRGSKELKKVKLKSGRPVYTSKKGEGIFDGQ